MDDVRRSDVGDEPRHQAASSPWHTTVAARVSSSRAIRSGRYSLPVALPYETCRRAGASSLDNSFTCAIVQSALVAPKLLLARRITIHVSGLRSVGADGRTTIQFPA